MLRGGATYSPSCHGNRRGLRLPWQPHDTATRAAQGGLPRRTPPLSEDLQVPRRWQAKDPSPPVSTSGALTPPPDALLSEVRACVTSPPRTLIGCSRTGCEPMESAGGAKRVPRSANDHWLLLFAFRPIGKGGRGHAQKPRPSRPQFCAVLIGEHVKGRTRVGLQKCVSRWGCKLGAAWLADSTLQGCSLSLSDSQAPTTGELP